MTLLAESQYWNAARWVREWPQALADGGWRIVALLRLNPEIPYSASNYLFGASGVTFLPYLLASGLFTLPGAFAYVYLGHVGAETLGGHARSGIEWTFLLVGSWPRRRPWSTSPCWPGVLWRPLKSQLPTAPVRDELLAA